MTGNSGGPGTALTENTPYQVFHNQGNNNHWIEIDLVGTDSNRDAIGARVILTAGGVTQLREQSGGMLYKAQNHQRLHFGLGDNETIDEIVITWPSGRVQKLRDLPVDQLITITEPSGD